MAVQDPGQGWGVNLGERTRVAGYARPLGSQVIAQARDAITVKRVFSEPYEKNGVTVIPAARVQGGAGGGGGEGPEGQGRGFGTGFGLSARPVGAFLIRGDELRWRPAVDLSPMLGGQVVAIVALLTIRAIVKARAKRGR